ncbi:aldo/keto reductase [Enterococcus faecalis]|uniref:aldo/keto reductase n=1 Tax=Enterococcus faecalis TaxID=1351 RepID=UPI0028056126|nr:aldo/keto reductase [Enterococcus faecalis]
MEKNPGFPRLSESLNNTLLRLGIDYLDMYLLHWRGSIPLERTIYDLENLVDKGKIRSWGVSNFDTSDILALKHTTRGGNCAANEVLYNIASRGIEYSLLPLQNKLELPLIAYAPTDQGDSRGFGLLSNKQLIELAYNKNCTIYQLMLAWVIRNGNTVAIPQTSNPEHMEQNMRATDIELTNSEKELINSISPVPHRKIRLDII